MKTRALVTSALFAGLIAAALASASPAQAASPRETEAARLFFAGQYPEALKIYVDLAVATGDPVYMCEIGRCYHRMGKLEEASRNLRDCLTQAQLAPKKKREFQTLQTEVETARKNAAGPPPPAVPAVPPGYPAQPPAQPGPPPGYPPQAGPPPSYPPQAQPAYPPQAQPGYPPQAQGYPPPGYPPQGQPMQGQPPQGPPPAWGAQPGQPPGPTAPAPELGPPGAPSGNLAATAEAPPAKGGGWMKPTALIAGSVGVLAVGFGAYSGYTANKKFDEVEKEYNENKEKNAKTYNTMQFVGYGLGGAALGAAVVLFILAPGSDEHAAADRLQIIASPQSVGLAGRF